MVYTSKNLILFHLYCYINLTLPNQGYRRQAPDSCPCLGGPVSLGYHPHTPRIHTPGLASGWRGPLVFCGILSYLSATIKKCILKILMPKNPPYICIIAYSFKKLQICSKPIVMHVANKFCPHIQLSNI